MKMLNYFFVVLLFATFSSAALASDKAEKMTEEQYTMIKALAKSHNDSLAQALFGSFYLQGMYGKKNKRFGIEWLEKSAHQENVFALDKLVEYYRGNDIKKLKYWQTAQSKATKIDPSMLEPQLESFYYKVQSLTSAYSNETLEEVLTLMEPSYGVKNEHGERVQMVQGLPLSPYMRTAQPYIDAAGQK